MTASKIEDWFKSGPTDQNVALENLRVMIRSVAKEAVEEIKWGRPCYSSRSDLFCYLNRTKSHVTIGFQRGGELDDSDDLLEGTGKNMRHIKFKGPDDVHQKRPLVMALLKQAAKL